MKKLSLFLLGFFLISCVSGLTIKSEAVNNVIVPDFNNPAKFILTITNAEPGSYNVYTLTDVKMQPASPFQLGGGVDEIEIYVYPTDGLDERGFYSFSYTLKKISGEDFEDSLTVKVVDLEDVIEVSSDSNEPGGKINFYVRNKENARLEGLKAKFSSMFFEVEKEFDLDAYEKLEFSVDVDKEKMKKISAGSYLLKAEFETDKGVKKIDGKIYLGEKKGIETQEDGSGILIYTNTVTKTNIGNVEEVVSIKMKKDIIARLFTNFNNEPDLIERSGFVVSYTWNKKLEPADVFVVKAKTNYIFPLLIVIFAGILVLGFKRYVQTKVDVKKSVAPVRTKGGQFALRVRLSVKAKKSVENVSLIDKVPAIVKVYEKFGTLKPDKIDTKNRRIQWDIGDLGAGEERIFSYIIYSKVGVVGKFSLPEALAVFERDSEIHEVESNKVFFLSEQTEKDED